MLYTGFQTTYEELKLVCVAIIGYPRVSLPDYLWGIETRGIENWWGNVWQASRLPMRNWNSQRATFLNQNVLASRLPMRNWNMRISMLAVTTFVASRLPMRNWNSSCRPWPNTNAWSFQTTYEELKLYNPNTAYARWLEASRLPMRNWNRDLKEQMESMKTASRLPMRNWNLGTDT